MTEKKITIDMNNGQAQLHYTNCTPFEVLGALRFFESYMISKLNKSKVKKQKQPL